MENSTDASFESMEVKLIIAASDAEVIVNEPKLKRVKYLLDSELKRQKAKIIADLKKIETGKWDDEKHCTCLAFAISQLKEEII